MPSDELSRLTDPTPDGVSEVELLASKLRADVTDIQAFVEGLAVRLEEMLPGYVTVDRRKQGLRGPKFVTRIQVANASESLELRRSGANIETVRGKVSGGITLKTERLDLDAWLEAIARLISDTAERSERARQSLERLLLGS